MVGSDHQEGLEAHHPWGQSPRAEGPGAPPVGAQICRDRGAAEVWLVAQRWWRSCGKSQVARRPRMGLGREDLRTPLVDDADRRRTTQTRSSGAALASTPAAAGSGPSPSAERPSGPRPCLTAADTAICAPGNRHFL